MKDEIVELIESTIAHIKAALDGNKPGEAKVYTEMLNLLEQTRTMSPPRSPNVDMNKPFKEISEKHIPDA